MKAAGDILVVGCYESGRHPSSVAAALAALEAAGYRPAAQDISVEQLSDEALGRARLVAISAPMHTALQLGVRVAERARAAGARVAFFGLYAALNERHLLERHCDAVVAGEASAPLVELVRRMEGGRGDGGRGDGGRAQDGVAEDVRADEPSPAPAWVGGRLSPRSDIAPAQPASSRAEASPAATGVGGRLSLRSDIAREPLPSRAALPLHDSYARLELDGQTRPVAAVDASRGCKHLCRHCPLVPLYRGRFAAVPVDAVLADAAQQIARGARHVSFGDPDFLNGPTHALRVARALHARFPGVTFDATIKVEHLLAHRALLPELVACGLLFVTSAVESLNDEALHQLDKGHTAADVPAALAAVRAAGAELRPTLLPYTPWTRLDDLPRLFDFAEEHDLVGAVDPVQFTLRLLLPEGSLLLERVRTEGFDARAFTHRWIHDDPRVDELQRASAAAAARGAGFDELKALTGARPSAPRPRRKVPRLTEPWFC